MRVIRNSRRFGAVLLTAALVLAVASAPAQAAPPSNDTFAGAVPITSVPFSTTQNTTEATTDGDDDEANSELCGAPATDASVWYSVTPAEDGALVVDVSSSSYSAGVLVVVGTPGSFDLVTCGPGAVAFAVTAGTTYSLMIIDDQLDGGGNGGTMVMNVLEAPPPPELSVTVDPTALFNPQDGSATIRAAVTCSGVVEVAFIDAELRQQVGRGEVFGVGGAEILCDGTPQQLSLSIFPIFGRKFAGGKAAALTFAFACGPFMCADDFQEHRVQLSRRG